MKLLSYVAEGQLHFGALLSEARALRLTALYPTALAFLEAGEVGMNAVRERMEKAERGQGGAAKIDPLASLQLKAPVPQARKLFALAGNYQEHIREGGGQTYRKEETFPYFFMKPPSTALIGSGEAIQYPQIGQKMDYEGELVIVIGQGGRLIAEERAYDHIAGYTILNDISERALASKAPPRAKREKDGFFDWLVGKWFDTGAPCGPWLVTKEEVADPHALRLQTRVNGETLQDGATGAMIFTVPEIVAFISRVVTLEPGDLIATGTPAGVGHARNRFLQPGDTVEVEIEGLGILRNRVV
jgi:2-keto-4-pentenoate hydratase/2-oxohepta-3-ene-1,7-dioic acid hydratase in catechol pathway